MLQAASVAAAAAEPPLGVGLPRLGEPGSEELNGCAAAPLERTPQLITLAVTFLADPELPSHTSDRRAQGHRVRSAPMKGKTLIKSGLTNSIAGTTHVAAGPPQHSIDVLSDFLRTKASSAAGRDGKGGHQDDRCGRRAGRQGR